MATYNFCVTRYGWIDIEADNEDEAWSQAEKVSNANQFEWEPGFGDLELVDVDEEEN